MLHIKEQDLKIAFLEYCKNRDPGWFTITSTVAQEEWGRFWSIIARKRANDRVSKVDPTTISRANPVNLTIEQKVRRNKFYVGSSSVFTRNWGHMDLAGALEHGKDLLEEKIEDDEIFVVQIIKVIRRKRSPIEVLSVK